MKKITCILIIILIISALGMGCIGSTENRDIAKQEDQIIKEEPSELLAQKEERVNFVNEAIELIDEKGELAFDDFRQKDSKWYHNDSYITVWKTEGIRVVFPPKVSVEGEDVNDLEDYNGEPLGRMFIDTALSEEGEGWINYYWPKPGETAPSKKSTFVKRTTIGNQTYLVHSGFYVNDYIYTKATEDVDFTRYGNISVGYLIHPAKVENDLDVDYSFTHVIIDAGKSIEPHIMKKPEVYYVLEGEGLLYIEDIPFELSKGKLVHIPANSKQYTESAMDADLEILVIDQPAWTKENEIILE